MQDEPSPHMMENTTVTPISPRHTLLSPTRRGASAPPMALIEASAFRRLLSCRALLAAPLPGNPESA